MPYISKKDILNQKKKFLSQDPEKREHQLRNLVQNRMKRARGNKPGTLQKSKVIIEDIPGWNIEIKIIKK